MRRKPWARPELDACPFYIKDIRSLPNGVSGVFSRPAPLWLELGCGKGGFVASTAARCPQINFLAVDIKSEVLALAKRAAEHEFAAVGREPDNLRLAAFNIDRIASLLSPADRVDRIYINFPNPWPKRQHQKHRLTHTRALQSYRQLLREGGLLFLRTDDDGLFRDTHEYLEQAGYRIIGEEWDAPAPARAPLTEHERMFRAEGLPIHTLTAELMPL